MSFFLDIANPGQDANRFELPAGIYTIGRGDACKIRLRHPEISERHALLTLRDSGVLIEDLHSSNGTTIDGVPVQEPTPVREDDVIGIGPCLLRLSRDAAPVPPPLPSEAAAGATPKSAPPADRARPDVPAGLPATAPQTGRATRTAAETAADPMISIVREIKNQIHGELIQRLDLKRMTVSRIGTDELQSKARETIRTIIAEVRRNQRLPAGIDPSRLEKEIYDEAMRLGPLEDFLADESITEIMVNGPGQVYIERNGKLELSGQSFMDDESVLGVIERIVAPIGRRIDESQPYVDARLPDGSRVNAIIAPLSLTGPCITIRKFAKRPLTVEDLINYGTWTRSAAEFLRLCVLMRKNIVVAGGTGSGKTTLLNVLSGFIPPTDRIVTIE
ncbi:MAG TPA: ATPase, T2SS/T4P/T4SS family, partial [Kiritimatiellia bacterium]|nr:ATPase, T2SS/T4P/T4SS family [Kiritimatiellia bacterium]